MTDKAEVVSLESFKASSGRDYYKREHIGKSFVTPDDVLFAAVNIYQDELGHWFEDDEMWDAMWADARASYLERRQTAKNRSELVDMIVADLKGDPDQAGPLFPSA
jgi:hypothetical protein